MRQNLQQQNGQEFIDKCTARWLFEKTGVHLYEEAIRKCPKNGPNGMRERLEEIRDQEKDHEEMLEEVIRSFGADPHQLTKSARITQMESVGIVNVVEKEDFSAVIDALLAAELVDTANWELLMMLGDSMGGDRFQQFRSRFEEALRHETEHLRFIRGTIVSWLTGREVMVA